MKTLLTTITALLIFGNVSAGENMRCVKVKDFGYWSISRCENKEAVCYLTKSNVFKTQPESMQCKFKGVEE